MLKEFTLEQIERRKNTKWTTPMMGLAMVQLLAYVVGFYLVIRYLLVGDFYLATTISIWVKIALMWAITIVGMLWEKDVCGQYFMHRDFFWEDFGNLVAMITHNAYFVVILLDYSEREIMYVMLFAYVTYLFNFVQWLIVGLRSYKQRKRLTAELEKFA